ncbi:primosomal protein N' [Marinoscillum sp. MHG1-6]|uniref:replication restart helicase PriA n=1 Tax=Marinoscillum sp. MHG1-6 TaxID=2959627 RepID=UPI0021575B42|nr:primosomal protein N' [Marinoscillum sp. MHG1-6]
MKFAEVILPLPLKGTFTYSIPETIESLEPGIRVIVQFGKRKIYTGVIYHLHDEAPNVYTPKEILDVLDESPTFTAHQLELFHWMSNYYMATIGEVINAALPSGLKIASESFVSMNPDIDLDDLDLTEKEQLIVTNLQQADHTLDELANLLEIKSPHHHIKSLTQKNVIHLFEKVKDKYTARTETRIRLDAKFVEEESLQQIFDELEKKPKQSEVLLSYVKLVNVFEYPSRNQKGVVKKDLINEGVSTSSLSTLVKKGVFEEWKEKVSRIPHDENADTDIPSLSPDQERAKLEILGHFQSKETVLLKGITGSGKTEVYISLIQDILDNEGCVLYLLPEIALTTQIIKRLRKAFGDTFGIYHSRYSDNERVEVWQKVLKGEYKFVVGVRSAVFLPFSDLSLIIVDEEHEPSYKQYDPAPRYHARDTAIYMASKFHAKTLLGTATPAIETYKNAIDGKFGLVRMDKRFGEVNLPDIVFANLSKERKKKTIKGNFSSSLLGAMEQTLSDGNQVILFQNRRGYAPYIECDQCGYHATCPNCDVSLTYHIYQNVLVCHYCGHKKSMITECPQCQSRDLRTMSFGTEKLEEELEIMLPHARIQRMDLDATRSKNSYQRIIDQFENGEIDILVGTQMVSKGLDFDKVSLVGVFAADRMINFPDFRAHERAFQLIHQVSGRAGRRKQKGQVIIQTNDPEQPILQLIKRHDYESFYRSEILERERFHYPPFFRMIVITLKDNDKQVVNHAAQFYYREISRQLGTMRVIGPVEPLIGKIRNQFLMEITVKVEKQSVSLMALKEFLLTSRNIVLSQRSFKSVRIQFDVDPI